MSKNKQFSSKTKKFASKSVKKKKTSTKKDEVIPKAKVSKIPAKYKHLQNSHKVSDAGIIEIRKEVKSLNINGFSEAKLKKISDSLNGHGVEYIDENGVNLAYVNMGDTYDETVIYDFDLDKVVISAWGNYFE